MSATREIQVLVVDDDPALCELLRTTFELEGIRVVDAQHVIEAERILIGARPDAIVLDIGLPGMSGPDMLTELRKPDSPWNALPVIVCSDSSNTAEGERCVLLGIHEFVPKDGRFIDALSASLRTVKWSLP